MPATDFGAYIILELHMLSDQWQDVIVNLETMVELGE